MGRSTAVIRIARPLDVTFDYCATHMRENHPSWEPEVLEIRPVTPGPVGVGTRAVMVRKDMGKVHETEYEVTAFEPGRRVAVRHADGPLDFAMEWLFAAVGPDATEVTVQVDASPTGAMRLLAPIFGLYRTRTTKRISADMARAVERNTPAPGAVGRPAYDGATGR